LIVIRGFKDSYDKKYYVPIKIYSSVVEKFYSINFLIDTGASTTSISFTDANGNAILYKYLEEHNVTTGGIGSGRVKRYVLSNIGIFFLTTENKYWYYNTQDIMIMDHETTEGKRLSSTPSLLGVDILNNFKLVIENDQAFLIHD